MAITKVQARKVRQPVLVGDLNITKTLDAVTTSDILELSSVAEKVTVQSSGNLAGNIEVSVNGIDFNAGVAFVANTMVTYSTHLVRVVRVNRTGGSGKLSLVAR